MTDQDAIDADQAEEFENRLDYSGSDRAVAYNRNLFREAIFYGRSTAGGVELVQGAQCKDHRLADCPVCFEAGHQCGCDWRVGIGKGQRINPTCPVHGNQERA